MENSDRCMFGQEVIRNSSQLDLQLVKSSSVVEDSKSAKVRAEVEVSKANKFVKEELSKVKFDVASMLEERIAAEKQVESLLFKTEENVRLLECLKKEIELMNEEYLLVELRKIKALMEYKEIEKHREKKAQEVLDLLVEKNKRIKKMLEDVERSKEVEKELFETSSDVEMLETHLKLVKKMEKKDKTNCSVNAELFEVMMVMDVLRNEISQVQEETAVFEKMLRKDDVKIQKLNSKMLMVKSKLEVVCKAEERISSLAENLVGSLEKLKRNKEAAKKEGFCLKEETMVTKVETEKTKLERDEKERELISKLDELENVKREEAVVLEKLETLIDDIMERRETESEHCSTITISRFEYEYLSKHGIQAEETAEKKVVAAEAWLEALKASTKAVLMKTETLIRESVMAREEEEKEEFKMERSLSKKRLVEEEIQKLKGNSEAESYLSPKPVGNFTPVQRGKPRRYSSVGTPTLFVIKKKKKVPTLAKFLSRKS